MFFNSTFLPAFEVVEYSIFPLYYLGDLSFFKIVLLEVIMKVRITICSFDLSQSNVNWHFSLPP